MTQHRLSGIEIDFLRSIPDGADRLVCLWRLLMPGEFDTAPSIDPRQHVLSRAQMAEVMVADFANGGGAWLNVGPSSR